MILYSNWYWFMILALIGIGKAHMDKNGRLSVYFSHRSFAFFSLHYICLVVMQYLMSGVLEGSIFLLYLVPVLASYVLTSALCELFVRVPVLSFLTGVKPVSKNGN